MSIRYPRCDLKLNFRIWLLQRLKKKQTEPTNPTPFTFIVSTGSRFSVTPEERSIIRKQAMRKAGTARKARRNYGKVNMIQYPTTVLPERLEVAAVHPTLETRNSAGTENRKHNHMVQDIRKGSNQECNILASDLSAPLEKRGGGHFSHVQFPVHAIPMIPCFPPADRYQEASQKIHRLWITTSATLKPALLHPV